MTEWADILFIVDPKISVETLYRSVRQLGDYCDVYLNLDDMEVTYCDGCSEPAMTIQGDMRDEPGDWERLVEAIKDIEGFEIDYEGMKEWIY